MVRRGQGRQSLNSSVVTVTNNSLLEDADRTQTSDHIDHAEFVKRFGRPDLEDASKIELIGYKSTIALLEDKIKTFFDPELQTKQDFALITGPSGTGKTSVVRKLAQKFSSCDDQNTPSVTFFYLKASWTLERQFGNPESRIRSLFDEAVSKAPSIIFIDKIDLICSEKRSQNDVKDRVFNVIEDKLEGLNSLPSSQRVLVLAATDRPEVMDPQIRKCCYFSEEIRFTLPSMQDRAEYLKHLIRKQTKPPKDSSDDSETRVSDEDLEKISRASHCYSYRDLNKLCNIAWKLSEGDRSAAKLSLSLSSALKEFKPVAIKSTVTPCPPLKWEDIGGVENVKKELQESVIWPLEHRDKFKQLGIGSNKGAILYGPPGCSKTMLAQALATESGYNFISVKGPELFSKFVGDSEAAVRRLYRNAREIAPCIIFFDEIDGFAPERSDNHSSSVGDKVVAQLLTELNGVEPLDNVFTIAATNRPDRVDSALMRPGRLDPAIYIPLPSERDRREILKVHMRPLALEFGPDRSRDSVVCDLAARTCGYSGAEIANVCRVAGTLALRESLDNEHIEWRHLEGALAQVKPRTRAEHLRAYERFRERSLEAQQSGDRSSSQDCGECIRPADESTTGCHLSSAKSNGLSPKSRSLPKTNGGGESTAREVKENIRERLKNIDWNRMTNSLRLKRRRAKKEEC